MHRTLSTCFLTLFVALPAPPVLAASASSARRRPVPRPSPSPSVPLEREAALAPFFQALQALESGQVTRSQGAPEVVRVLHFGDSHTAADVWTGRIRARLQARFGDAGPGLLLPARPWRGYSRPGLRQLFDRHWPATSLRQAEGDGRVGLTGAALFVPAGQALCVVGCFAWTEVLSLGGGPAPSLELAEPAQAEAPEGVVCAPAWSRPRQASFPPSPRTETLAGGPGEALLSTIAGLDEAEAPRRACVSVGAWDRLLSVDLRSGRSGVLYDELGLNGGELGDLERWEPALRERLLARAHASLVVVAYGANEAGGANLDEAAYVQQATRVLQALAAESGAPLLVVGPTDRSSRRSRTARRVAQGLTVVVRALRTAAGAAGAAFWDARAAMGGPGAVAQWRRRGLARRDLVHLTAAGYQRLGDALAEALLQAYARHLVPPTPAESAGRGRR